MFDVFCPSTDAILACVTERQHPKAYIGMQHAARHFFYYRSRDLLLACITGKVETVTLSFYCNLKY